MEHLRPEFDPNKIVVAQLRNILLRHDVPWPANAKKTQLVALYESHIRPQAPMLLRESLGVKASDYGILDGESRDGASLAELDTASDGSDPDHRRTRPKSRSLGLKQDARPQKRALPATSVSGRVLMPKRKKDSAEDADEREQHRLVEFPAHKSGSGRPSGSTTGIGDLELNAQGASRPTASARQRTTHLTNTSSSPRASTNTPRRSLNYDSSGEAGFSDYNPFQSGSEDTPERKPRRKVSGSPAFLPFCLRTRSFLTYHNCILHAQASLGPGKSRVVDNDETAHADSPLSSNNRPAKNLSLPAPTMLNAPTAGGQHQLSSGAAGGSSGRVALPGRRYVAPRQSIRDTPDEVFALEKELEALDRLDQDTECAQIGGSSQESKDYINAYAYDGSSSSASELEGQIVDASKDGASRLGNATDSVLRRFTAPPMRTSPLATAGSLSAQINAKNSSMRRQIFTALLSLLLLAFALWWREEKLNIGFCDTQTTHNALSSSRSDSLVPRSFAPHWSSTWLTKISPDVWRRMDQIHLRPSCVVCPSHGICDGGQFLGCEPDYIIRPHPLRLGGLIPLAPRCDPDSDKLMLIAVRASRLAARLRAHRGNVICGRSSRRGMDKVPEVHLHGVCSEDIARWAKEDNSLSPSPLDENHIEDLNKLALRDLQDHGEVLAMVDRDKIWYAATSADMPLRCKLRLAAWRQAREHTGLLTALLAMIATCLYARLAWARHVHEASHLHRLVHSALVLLRKQAEQSRIEGVVTSEPAIAQSHLRDLILQEEHSPARRERLWTQVARVVEGNANVRAKEVELAGEELRAWEWTGKIDRTDAMEEEMMERKSLKRIL
ncbi:BQ2448_5746 [Microbotryum intermedium]|uniref:BQ2448_5746 protein n=1 Tax=Microbotryum intermedium TaxID=269621 RepID=A0A238EZ35_9BASI|nr:BQ2448_5746 [Microbotryum intermedium]